MCSKMPTTFVLSAMLILVPAIACEELRMRDERRVLDRYSRPLEEVCLARRHLQKTPSIYSLLAMTRTNMIVDYGKNIHTPIWAVTGGTILSPSWDSVIMH
ncbi:hypothetical protein lerEdw1_018128 [Lerista edwardsae]|nr:hypothetical protein lerEdw1_018128 [Lerista edwardsae]